MDELIRLYNFGAEMRLIRPGDEVHGLLHSTRERFRKMVKKATTVAAQD